MNFKLPYDRDQCLDFLQHKFLPDDFERSNEPVLDIGFKTQLIQSAHKIGESSSLDIKVYEIRHVSENDPRVSLSRETFRLLAYYECKRALIFFVSDKSPNYRFSLATIDLRWEEGKRVKKEYSNPRRYSFFLGPASKTHTPEEYLIKRGRIKEFADLAGRFSVEVVNKDFYEKIAILFTKLAGGERKIGKDAYKGSGVLRLPSTADDTLKKEFAIRLIGRLVFCWFLKKKHSDTGLSLLPEELLSSQAVTDHSNYYHSILEPLFFEVLNSSIDQRRKQFQSDPWAKIPFLNGGLFSPDEHDFYDPTELGMSKFVNVLKVPDNWISELFRNFETYNFTIDENTSVDVELSIDPEMLGRIFENLLAEINPQTGETARKATGSYYTPRSIVEYMVDESLKQYLLTKVKISEDFLSRLLSYGDDMVDLKELEKDSIIDALDSLKVIDPACGSGAFPMGILHKMLLVLQKIDPESQKWIEKKLSQIESITLKKELGKKLRQENWNYVHKLGIIQSSIYGVDIQPIAAEISRLRFFLSLIVDEKVEDPKPNRGIDPLPNLEFKFACANSLIPLAEESGELFDNKEMAQQMQDIRDRFFKTDSPRIKSKMKKDFEDLLKKGSSLFASERQKQLLTYHPFDVNNVCGFFDSKFMFGVNGFDIVIANPPYISSYGRQAQEFKTEDIQYYIQNFSTFIPVAKRKNISLNTVMLFIEQGHRLLKPKGCLCYIVDQALLNVDVYSYSRDYILQKFSLNQIVTDLNFPQVIAEACILLFDKSSPIPKYNFLWKKKNVETTGDRINIEQILNNNNKFSLSNFDALMTKIERETTPLCECAETFTGMQIIPEYFLSDDDNVLKLKKWHKAVFSSNIKRYKIVWPTEKQKGKYITYDTDLQRKVRKMLQEKVQKGEKCRAPESLSIGSDEKEYRFYTPKIIMPQTVSNANKQIQLQACIDDVVGYYGNVSIHLIKHDNLNYLKYLVAILNSRLMSFYAVEKKLILGAEVGSKKTPQIRKGALDLLPIKNIPAAGQKPFILVVDKIIALLNNDGDILDKAKISKVNQCQREIDQMIYELYGLTKKEIDTIENL